jgi:glutamine amidotransferase
VTSPRPQKIAIVDYGMGNLRSVANAFEAVGWPAQIASMPGELEAADKIVLPGVGAFGDGMRNLRERGWVAALESEVRQKGKPFLGLCLGLQLIARSSTEHGQHQGLGWIDGEVVRLEPSSPELRVPHIGWNSVQAVQRGGLFARLGERCDFYFVHSYVLRPKDASVVSGLFDYGGSFVASVETRNLYATQFHPEKSQKHGLAILANFVAL